MNLYLGFFSIEESLHLVIYQNKISIHASILLSQLDTIYISQVACMLISKIACVLEYLYLTFDYKVEICTQNKTQSSEILVI